MSKPPVSEVLDLTACEPAAEELSFDALFRRYAPYVGAIALRILGRNDEVDDVVQDVFVDAYRGLRELRDPTAIKGWLSRIAVRTAIRKLRRRKLRALFFAQPQREYREIAAEGASPELAATIAQIYRSLDELPVDERVAWSLRHVSGEELEQIASLTGASLATVKRRIARANERLRGHQHG